jgi:hypothetical protein
MDLNKTKWHLLDFGFLEKVVDVFQKGADRPGREEDGWRKLEPSEQHEKAYFDACLRHLLDGDFASVAANAMILHHHAKWRETKS